ncbi:hypothetical protein HZB04_03865 [Candidatus Wolfebacteria bacterium]|nr:hypothetical protein [Candidatus Wolfebacteria bacterium]
MKPILVLYHKNCPDGFGGAYAAWKKFGDKADYVGIERYMPLINLKGRKEVYMIDFCYFYDEMKKIIDSGANITVIDHHVSVEKAVKICPKHSYGVKNSGSVLAWKYFHSKKPIPRLLKNIEDLDLWKFKIPHTKEISSVLELIEFNFKKWDKFIKEFENPKKRKKHIEAGKIILKYRETLIKRIINHLKEVKFEGHKAFAVNSPIFQSEIGNFINKNKKVLGIIWSFKKGKINISLRGGKKIDVAKIAEKYDGGGHRGAAGFAFDSDIKFPWKTAKKKIK